MTTLTFQTPEEARAWDMYVAGFALASDPYLYADQALLERRKRMAPEKVEREWIPHNPGGPMPCDGETMVEVMLGIGTEYVGEDRDLAENWNWNNESDEYRVAAWRPA
jgi:hypothetical protein